MPYYKEDFPQNNYNPWNEVIYFALVVFGLALFFSLLTACSTTKTVSDKIAQKDSIVQKCITRNDTAATHTIYKDRFIDHYINNTFVVSPLGDTVRQNTLERIYESVNTHQSDSIRILQAYVDSLQQIKQKERVVIQEKQLTKWQKTKIDTYEYLLIALLACIAFVVGYIFYRIKKG